MHYGVYRMSEAPGIALHPTGHPCLGKQQAPHAQPIDGSIESDLPGFCVRRRCEAARQGLRRLDARHPPARGGPSAARWWQMLRERHQHHRIAQHHAAVSGPLEGKRDDAAPGVARCDFKGLDGYRRHKEFEALRGPRRIEG